LAKAKLPTGLMVDCSHANSGKVAARQEDVWHSIIEQRLQGSPALIGAMIESHIHEGAQPFPKPIHELQYGISITDACLSWETTERMLRWGYAELKKR
jgi:3-deoxy-7-phosphoheptulonate synthase